MKIYATLIRIEEWWNVKVSLFYGVLTLFALQAGIGIADYFTLVGVSFAVLFPVAAWANIINDFGDLESDALANKPNRLANWSRAKRWFFGIAFIPFLFVLPYFLESSVLEFVWFFSICLSFFLYSIKPFRFKSKGWWGALMDALGTQVFPAFFVLSRINVLTNEIEVLDFVLVGGWLLFSGLRLHLVHQFMDIENDLKGGLNTIFTRYSIQSITKVCNYILVPLELFFLVFVILFGGMYFMIPALIFYFMLQFILAKKLKIVHVWFKVVKNERVWLSEFYNYYILFITLILCSMQLDVMYFLPLIVFGLLFNAQVLINLKEALHIIRWWKSVES